MAGRSAAGSLRCAKHAHKQVEEDLASPEVADLLALHRALALADGQPTTHVEYCEQLLKQWSEAELNPPVLVTGHALEAMGLRPGPVFKELLDLVRNARLEGTIHSREEAISLLQSEVGKKAPETMILRTGIKASRKR